MKVRKFQQGGTNAKNGESLIFLFCKMVIQANGIETMVVGGF